MDSLLEPNHADAFFFVVFMKKLSEQCPDEF